MRSVILGLVGGLVGGLVIGGASLFLFGTGDHVMLSAAAGAVLFALDVA